MIIVDMNTNDQKEKNMKREMIIVVSLATLGLAALPMPGFYADAMVHTITASVNQVVSISAPTASTTTGNSLSATKANGETQEWAPTSTGGGGAAAGGLADQ